MSNPENNPFLDFSDDLSAIATDIACWRVEAIEKAMRLAPDTFSDYAKARTDIEREKARLIQKLEDSFALEPLMNALMAYHGELVFEVYKQAALDGGRIYHAFVTHGLPQKEETHDEQATENPA